MPNPIIDLGYRYACNRFPGDGVETDFEINFAGGYLRPEHVVGFLKDPDNNVEEPLSVSGRTLVIFGPNQVRVTPAVPDGITLVVRRDTPKEGPMLDYNDGAILNDVNLNTSNKQAIFAVAEMVDYFADFLDIFRGISQDVIDALDYAQQALLLAQQALALAQQALDRANAAYALAEQALERANEAWDLANSKPDSFLELNDTPNSYTGEGGNVAIAKVDETGMDLVPVEEIPGLEEFITNIVEEHGGGGGGIPTTAPVVLHSTDAGIPNGLVLTEGSNITLTDNGSGGLVIAATGGGGSVTPGKEVFAVGNAVLGPNDVQGVWADPTGAFVPPNGATNISYKNMLHLASESMAYPNSVKFGVRLEYNRPSAGGNVSIGSRFTDPGVAGSCTPDITKGIYIDPLNISIGSGLKSKTNEDPRYGGNIVIAQNSAFTSSNYPVSGSLVIKPYGLYGTDAVNTGDLRGVYQFGPIDLGGLPGAVGFHQHVGINYAGPHGKVSFVASAGEEISGDVTFAIGGSIPFKDLTAGSADPENPGSTDSWLRTFCFEVTVVGTAKAAKLKAVIQTSRLRDAGTKTITIVHQSQEAINGTGESGLTFNVVGNELHLIAAFGSGYFNSVAFIERSMISRLAT